MAIEEFSDCVAGRLDTTGDFIITEMRNFGDENIKRFLAWWNSLSSGNQGLILAIVNGVGLPAARQILIKVFGAVAAEEIFLALGTLLASFSLGALLTSMALCAGQLP
ncbi:hypothetical protein [Nocardia sp. R7R-8]|uniref:hypothetical protein n=1 Tax=Nocardia sp. R7R-8 TaxID=3459304 RepID=UPI00403D8DD4